MSHTITDHPLFSDALWLAEGQYVDEGGIVLPVHGSWRLRPAQVIAEDDDEAMPVLRAEMDLRLVLLQGEHPAFSATYLIEPPGDPREAFWSWESLALGPFTGRFTAVGDSLMSQAFSHDGQYLLSECFILTDEEDAYLARGVLSRDNETIASWSLTWERHEDDEAGGLDGVAEIGIAV